MALSQEGRSLAFRAGAFHGQEEGRPAALDPSALRKDLLLVQLRPAGTAGRLKLGWVVILHPESYRKKTRIRLEVQAFRFIINIIIIYKQDKQT